MVYCQHCSYSSIFHKISCVICTDKRKHENFEMADVKDKDTLYKAPVIQKPTFSELSKISEELGLQCTDAELESTLTNPVGGGYQIVNDLIAPTLPVKYPRTPGCRPEPRDNACNAWYWKCDIKGAEEGLLNGKTVGIKDNVCVAGVPMMNGSKLMQGYVPDIDATVVTKILDAGGRVVGKTNCENLCCSGSSWTNDTGPTLNPIDNSRSSGGSSSGSAVAVYNGDCDMAVGGDQGGSIRMPASMCGIVGLKPTWGLVPYTGAVSIETTCDHLGPMARNVRDCALLLEAMAGYDDGLDPRQPRNLETLKYSQHLNISNLDGWKVGLLTEGFNGCDFTVQSIVRTAAEKLMFELGAAVEDVSIPMHDHGVPIWGSIFRQGTYQCMLKGAGAGYHYKGYYPESLMRKMSSVFRTEAKQFPEHLKRLCLLNSYMEKNYGNVFYGRAQNLNIKLTKAYDEALTEYDVIIMPTLPALPPLLPKENATFDERMESMPSIRNTAPFDITGHPAISINAGKSEGLPVGMMIVGKQFDDVKVLQAAYAFEQLQNK